MNIRFRTSQLFWSDLWRQLEPISAAHLRRTLWAAASLSAVINLLLLVPSIYMLQVYDRVLTSGSLPTLLMLSIMTLFTLVMVACMEYARSGLMASAADRFEQDLQAKVWEKSLRESISADHALAAAHGANQSLRDLTVVRSFLASSALFALFDAPWVLVYATVIFLMHPYLGIFAFLSAVFLLLLALISDRTLRRSVEATQENLNQVLRFQDAVHRNADLVMGLRMMPSIAKHAQQMAKASKYGQLKMLLSTAFYGSSTKFTRQTVQIVMLAIAAYVSIVHDATPGIMIAATVLLGRALSPAEQAIGAWRQLVEVRASWLRLTQLLTRNMSRSEVMTLPHPQGILRCEGLSFAPRPSTPPILKNIQFESQAGELIAIVGPSGSGKSTLTRLLVGLWQPNMGKVSLDGVDLRAWDDDQLSQVLGYMPQHADLLEGTIAQNIARFRQYRDEDVIAAAQLANAHGLISGLEKAYDTPTGASAAFNLSGGQKQRIALARAVYGEPRLIVLDEPNASLDYEGEQALLKTLIELKKRKITVVVVTQKTNLFSITDRVIVMQGGRIERIGTPNQLQAHTQQQRRVPATQAGADETVRGIA